MYNARFVEDEAFAALSIQGHEPGFNIPLVQSLVDICSYGHGGRIERGISLITSGIRLPRYIDFLCACDTSIAITFHGANTEDNDEVYGAQVFRDAVQGIKDAHTHCGAWLIHTTLVLVPHRFDKLIKIPYLLAELGIKHLTIGLEVTYDSRGIEVLVHTREEILPYIERFEWLCDRLGITLKVANEVGQAEDIAPKHLLSSRYKDVNLIYRFDQATSTWAQGNELFLHEKFLRKLTPDMDGFPIH